MTDGFGSARHLVRLALLILGGLVIFLLVRAALMPVGFGVLGHYRVGAIEDNRLKAVSYAGQKACVECHSDVGETRATGRHAKLSCEGCHGPLAKHAEDPGTAAATKPNPRTICLRCHASNRSRPKFIPQIVVADHADDGPCTACHQPHRPGLS